MKITITPRTSVKAVLTVLMPYAHPAAVQGMAECIRDYCQYSAAGQRDPAAQCRARFEGMLEILCRIGQLSPFDRQQVTEFLQQVDALCIRQSRGEAAWGYQPYGF